MLAEEEEKVPALGPWQCSEELTGEVLWEYEGE